MNLFKYAQHVRPHTHTNIYIKTLTQIQCALLTLAKESGAASEKDALILEEHLHGRLICKDQCKQPLNN